MKLRNVLLAVTVSGFAVPAMVGCSAHAQVAANTTPTATATTPPPDPTPPPPPAPPPQPKVKSVGNAQINGNKITLPGELEFASGKATIKDTKPNEDLLKTLTEVLKENTAITKLRIEGHTDNVGKAASNLKLSQERADAVGKYLTGHGIDASRLDTKGFGDTKPLVANDTADHKAMNRRAEFHIEEIDGKPATDNTTVPADSSSTATPSSTTSTSSSTTSATPASTAATH